MKAKVLLLIDADHASADVVSLAAIKTGHRVVHAHTSREAFSIMERGLDDVDAVVIDVDPGVHGMAVLESMHLSTTTPPVIVLTGLEETYMCGIAAVHGAAACIGKPFAAEKLAALIEQVCQPAWRSAGCTSDAWGHPHRCQSALFPSPGCRRRQRHAPTALDYANV
jgi:DNA-binding response OmpR family regulator